MPIEPKHRKNNNNNKKSLPPKAQHDPKGKGCKATLGI